MWGGHDGGGASVNIDGFKQNERRAAGGSFEMMCGLTGRQTSGSGSRSNKVLVSRNHSAIHKVNPSCGLAVHSKMQSRSCELL